MSDNNDIDNVRYSFESQEFFQRQLEQSVNELINKVQQLVIILQ
jgi:hypothetical protein